MLHDNINTVHIIHNINNKYCYETDTTLEKLNKYQTTLHKCDNFDKPLRAISYYKVSELKEIYKNMLQNINSVNSNSTSNTTSNPTSNTTSNPTSNTTASIAKCKLYELLMQQL